MSNCVTHHACECIEADRKRLREERDEAVQLLKDLCDACDLVDIWRSLPYSDSRAFLARMEVKP